MTPAERKALAEQEAREKQILREAGWNYERKKVSQAA